MNRGLYAACSAMLVQETNLDTVTNNLANVDTVGFRRRVPVNAEFSAVMERLDSHYTEEDQNGNLFELRNFYPLINQYAGSIRFVSVALYLDGQLIAGDLAILSGKLYRSLTGFHDAPSAGSAQLILLARELVKKGVVLWDFGVSSRCWDPYKLRLGAEKMTPEEYLKLFHSVNPGSEKIFTKKHKD